MQRRVRFLGLAIVLLAAACTGPSGKDGQSCSVADNGDGTKTISCPGSSPVTIANGQNGQNGAAGADGTSCTVVDNGNGTKTISCTDNTSVTVSNGQPCNAVDNGNGTTTITCPGGSPITIQNGTTCSVVDNAGVKVLSCSDGSRTVISPPIDTTLADYQEMPGVVVAVAAVGGHSNADGSFHPGDHVAVTFSIKTSAGNGIPIDQTDLAGVWLAGPNSNYQHILPAARDQEMYSDVAARATLNDDGTYTYVFTDAIPSTFGVPLYDTAKFSDGELTGPLTAGTYTLGLVVSKNYTIGGAAYNDANSTTYDFGLDTATLSPHQVVADGNCQQCHERLRMHQGMYRSTTTCVTCHTAGAEDVGSTDTNDPTPNTIEFRVLIHKIHNGAHLPSVNGITVDAGGNRTYGTGTPYLVGPSDFSSVQFPALPNFNIALPKNAGYSLLSSANKAKDDNVRKGTTDCTACHGDPDGPGPLPAPLQGVLSTQQSSRRACGACHDDIDFTKPYNINGATMPANVTDDVCHLCHDPAVVPSYHLHPVSDPTVTPKVKVDLLSMSGGSAGGGSQFLAGDPLTLNFDVKDASGNNLPINWLDSMTLVVTGPTQNRNVVIPGVPSGTPIDLAGRLAAASTTNKGTMSKAYNRDNTSVNDTLIVDFTSSTAFTVRGYASGAIGAGALPAAASTIPSGASISNIVLSGAVAQNITVTFQSPTVYTVTGSVSGAMGTGTLPASVSNTQRFTSTDGTVSFNIVIGTTAPAANQSFYMSVVSTAAPEPLMFAIVAGRTAFATADRFYYDYVAPAASYTLKVPEDLALEYLGRGDGSTNQVFTAANLPVRYGRQTLLERTASPGTVMTLAKPVAMMARYLYVNTLDPGIVANDYLVIEDGTGNEEYVRVNAVDGPTGRIDLTTGGGSTGYSSNPVRFAHNAGATVQKVTLTYRQEGAANYYQLDPTTGHVTLNGASTAGNAFIMSYRTDARFGWKRKAGDAIAPFYYTNLFDNPQEDETWGDWRGKPIIDGTYSISLWGYRAVEYKSGAAGAYEWQTYRAASDAATLDFLYGATATTLTPYDKIPDTSACDKCHRGLRWHGGSRNGPATCLMCHATPGNGVHYRQLLHVAHGDTLPVMPNGAGECAKCHGNHDVTQPLGRNHPTAQVMPSRDWTRACITCHSSSAAAAHADTQTSSASGQEACATCHDPDRPYPVARMHEAR